jgi:hypothetical protein
VTRRLFFRACPPVVLAALLYAITTGRLWFELAAVAGLWTVILADDTTPWHRARTWKKAQRAGEADGYQKVIDALRDDDFTRWETEYCDSRPLPDPDTAWWDA